MYRMYSVHLGTPATTTPKASNLHHPSSPSSSPEAIIGKSSNNAKDNGNNGGIAAGGVIIVDSTRHQQHQQRQQDPEVHVQATERSKEVILLNGSSHHDRTVANTTTYGSPMASSPTADSKNSNNSRNNLNGSSHHERGSRGSSDYERRHTASPNERDRGLDSNFNELRHDSGHNDQRHNTSPQHQHHHQQHHQYHHQHPYQYHHLPYPQQQQQHPQQPHAGTYQHPHQQQQQEQPHPHQQQQAAQHNYGYSYPYDYSYYNSYNAGYNATGYSPYTYGNANNNNTGVSLADMLAPPQVATPVATPVAMDGNNNAPLPAHLQQGRPVLSRSFSQDSFSTITTAVDTLGSQETPRSGVIIWGEGCQLPDGSRMSYQNSAEDFNMAEEFQKLQNARLLPPSSNISEKDLKNLLEKDDIKRVLEVAAAADAASEAAAAAEALAVVEAAEAEEALKIAAEAEMEEAKAKQEHQDEPQEETQQQQKRQKPQRLSTSSNMPVDYSHQDKMMLPKAAPVPSDDELDESHLEINESLDIDDDEDVDEDEDGHLDEHNDNDEDAHNEDELEDVDLTRTDSNSDDGSQSYAYSLRDIISEHGLFTDEDGETATEEAQGVMNVTPEKGSPSPIAASPMATSPAVVEDDEGEEEATTGGAMSISPSKSVMSGLSKESHLSKFRIIKATDPNYVYGQHLQQQRQNQSTDEDVVTKPSRRRQTSDGDAEMYIQAPERVTLVRYECFTRFEI